MKKRFLPVLLVMFIIAAMIPTFALADSSEMSGKEFLALEKNGVINMTGNVTLTSSAVIRGDLIIQLNGYTLSRDTSNSNSLGVLLLDISSGSVTIVVLSLAGNMGELDILCRKALLLLLEAQVLQ